MSDDREPDRVSIDVQPAPTRAEAAAIVAALHAMMREQPSASGDPIQSVWQRAARREALHTELTHDAAGWRQAARLENEPKRRS